ncbi:MAG: ATP-binding protein [bacterium]
MFFLAMPAALLSLFALIPLYGSAEIRITKAAADGRDLALSHASQTENNGNGVPVTFASSSKSVAFHFQATPAVGECVRLKYKLEGLDPDWCDLESHMIVWLRVLDKKGNFVAGSAIDLTGESRGWTGSPADTPLMPFSMSVAAPLHAAKLRMYFISNGTGPVVGHLVVDAVNVRIEHADGTPPGEFEITCSTGNRADGKQAVLDTWTREGERPELAQVLWRTDAPPRPVLFLNDDDPDKFGVWNSVDDTAPAVKEGDRVTMTCRIAYSIGYGGPAGAATYGKLNPGTYWFRVAAFQVNGLPTGTEVSLPVVVVPPLYRRAEFWLALVVAFFGLLLLTIRLVVWRRMKGRLEQSEHQRMLEAERSRIARDIHDDLGATLAQIAMLSELAEADEQQSRPVGTLLHDIFMHAHDTTRKLDEIVWALKPANDTLEHLVGYLCQFAENYLKLAGLRFRLDAPETLPACTLTSGQRHNLFLAAKEALHNVVKHAGASEVWLRIRVQDNVLCFQIEDNGSGQAPSSKDPAGRGSANMKNRMEQLGGGFLRIGTPGRGTIVEFKFTMKPDPL